MIAKLTGSKYRMIGIAAGVVGIAAIIIFATSFSAAETAADDGTPEATADTEAEEKAAIPVEVVEVSSGAISSYISATANLVPENQIKILAETEGRISRLLVEEGDRIASGQVLAELVRDEAEIAVNKARLKGSTARLAFDRAADTLDQGLISREEFDRLKMEHEVAQQEIAEAEWRLSKTIIRAPYAGVVTERFINPGQHLMPGNELFSIADFEPLVARIFLPEKDVLSLDVGRDVRITLAANASLAFEGRIRQISPVVDTATGTVKITVEAVRPPAQVRPGAFVGIDIVREKKSAAILLPRVSVIRELRSAHVFVTDGDEALKRSVTLGIEEGDMIEALSGVAAGDRVIVAGQGGLKEGAKIKAL